MEKNLLAIVSKVYLEARHHHEMSNISARSQGTANRKRSAWNQAKPACLHIATGILHGLPENRMFRRSWKQAQIFPIDDPVPWLILSYQYPQDLEKTGQTVSENAFYFFSEAACLWCI